MPVLNQDALNKYDNIWTGQHTHADVRKKAVAVGGACTKRFNQGMSEWTSGFGALFNRLSTRDNEAWNGACYALCVFWASFHAKDLDFWGWLFSEADNQSWGEMNRVVAARIVGFHGALYNKKFKGDSASRAEGGFSSADQYAENTMLQLAKLRKTATLPKRGVGSGNSIVSYVTQRAGLRSFGNYLLLSLWQGPGAQHSGHETAIFVGSPDIAYFDPNLGEFWFPNGAAFSQWFPVYWQHMYNQAYQTFSLRRFGVAI